MNEIDIAVIGAGPAGLSAGLYGARGLDRTVLFERATEGGQIITTTSVDNYPGSEKDATGPSLIARMREQALSFGAEIIKEDVQNVEKIEDGFLLHTQTQTHHAKTVILACGAHPRKLDIPGEEAFTGLGVSYCATCDGAFFKEMDICVIGGGDTALKEALYLTRFAKSVTVIHRREAFRAGRRLVEAAEHNAKIKLMTPYIPLEIKGEYGVDEIVLQHVQTGEILSYPTMGVFVFVGYIPNSSAFLSLVDVNAQGAILTDANLMTKTPGLFAAGDVREKPLRQVITAACDGAISAVSASAFLQA